MEDIITYQEKSRKEQSLQKQISELTEFVIKEKRFIFKQEELPFDISSLLADKVLTKNGDQIQIGNSALFFNEFYQHFAHEFSFEISESVTDLFSFADKVKEELITKNPVNTEIFQIIRNFRSFLLYHAHKQLNCDFDQFVISLNKESGNILYDFNSAYCSITPHLSTSTGILFENLQHLMDILRNDTMLNNNTADINSAMRKYCIINPSSGEELLSYALKKQPRSIHHLDIPIIAGLYEIKGDIFWDQIITIFKSEENYVSIICALVNFPASSNEEAKKQYELITSIVNPSLEVLLNLPKFYLAIIKNENVTDTHLRELCFEHLGQIIINSDQKVRTFTLWEIRFLDNFDIETVELLKKLISTSDFDKQQLQDVGSTFVNHKHLPSFIDFLLHHAKIFKIHFTADYFSSAIYYFLQNESENFSKELITLLTNDEGPVRYIGNKILDYFKLHNRKFKFSANILELPALTQYKLWMSVTGELKQPKETLPMLMPLVDSSFSFVQEAFISNLELTTEQYSSSVLDVIKEELDMKNPAYLKIYERVKEYNENFHAPLDKKRGIKEFDPVYTNSKLFRLHAENHGKSWNKTINESTDRNSLFMNLVKTVVLAKGGGWKHEDKKEISKLSTIGVSFQVPRSLFILPELFDWEFRTRYAENWKNKFSKWEAIISS